MAFLARGKDGARDAVRQSTEEDPLALSRRAATGEPEATAKLLRMLAPEVLRVVRGVMGPYSADVDDAVQQALIALIHALPSFRGECAPAGFACRIAFRTALSVRRRARLDKGRRDSSVHTDAFLGASRADDAPRLRTELIRALLDDLPAEQAEALALRTMLGFSLEEIAETSQAPLNTIRSRLRLAKEALRKRLENDPALLEALGEER